MALENDTQAPDFELPDQSGSPVRLGELCSRSPVSLVFFPSAFSDVCTGEFCALRDHFSLFARQGVALVGVSVDSPHVLRAWAEQEGFDFPLLSDFWPHGQVSKEYGVFLAERGTATRATFLIDRRSIIRESFITTPAEPRSLEAYEAALEELRAA